MKKNNAIFKYVLFYSYGQYKTEKNIGAYALMLLFEGGLWAMIFYFLYERITMGLITTSSAIIIAISAKVSFAVIEKYGEVSIGFNLKNYFNIKNKDILKLRFLAKIFNISEYFFFIVVILLSLSNGFNTIAITQAIIAIVLYYIMYEVFSYVSYQYKEFESPVKQMLVLIAAIIFYCFLPVITSYMNVGDSIDNIIGKICFIFIFILTIYIICKVLIFRAHYNYKPRLRKLKKHSYKSIPNATKTLIKKDVSYVFKEKKSIWILPVVYLIMFYFIGGKEMVNTIAPFYFPLEFAVTYGFNYYGHENEALITVFLSPVSKLEIVRSKNLLFILLCFGFEIVFYFIGIVFDIISFANIGYYISFCLISLSIILPLCNYFSRKYYYRVNGKEKYTIRFILISILLFSVLSISTTIILVLKISQKITIFICMLMFIVSVWITCIEPYDIARKLNLYERELLNKYNL